MEKVRMPEVVGEYLYANRHKSGAITHEELAGVIRKARAKMNNRLEVTSEQLHSYVSKAREYLEAEYKCTIWNLRNYGFRIASSDELAMYTAKSVRRTIVIADRTIRLTDIVDRKKMPQALRLVFADNEKRIKTLGVRGKKFMSTFIEYIKEEKTRQLEKETHNGKTKKN